MSQIITPQSVKTIPVALAALGSHMHEHDLPSSIDVRTVDGMLEVCIFTDSDGQAKWLSSVIIESELNEPGMRRNRIRTQWEVRLPDTGIRLQLVAHRDAPLQIVDLGRPVEGSFEVSA